MSSTQEKSRTAQKPALQIFLLLAFYVVVWTAYASWTQLNLDGFGDMLENFSWGIAWQNGYFKHPPLFAWITAAWFSVFPRADWAYYLLSAVNSAVAFLASWRIAVRFLDPWRAVMSTALFFFLPPVSFLAIKYNANAAMLPFWAATVLFYLRFLEKRRLLDAVLLGALAACSMLVKYYSAALLGAICLHMLFDREARALFAGAGVWVASAVFFLLMAPHLVWLVEHDFLPLTYAAEQGDGSALAGIASAPRFLGALIAYLLPAILVLSIALLRNGRGAWFETRQIAGLRNSLTGRALLWTSFGSLGLTLILGIVLAARFSSVWALPLYFSAPILLMLFIRPGRLETWKAVIPIAIVVYSAALLAFSPFIRAEEAKDSSNYNGVPVRAIALEIEKVWDDRFDKPLAYVAGDKILASGSSFYASARPFSMQDSSFRLTPWVTEADVRRKGIVIACFAEQAWCLNAAGKFPVKAVEEERISVPGFTEEKTWEVRLFIVPPA